MEYTDIKIGRYDFLTSFGRDSLRLSFTMEVPLFNEDKEVIGIATEFTFSSNKEFTFDLMATLRFVEYFPLVLPPLNENGVAPYLTDHVLSMPVITPGFILKTEVDDDGFHNCTKFLLCYIENVPTYPDTRKIRDKPWMGIPRQSGKVSEYALDHILSNDIQSTPEEINEVREYLNDWKSRTVVDGVVGVPPLNETLTVKIPGHASKSIGDFDKLRVLTEECLIPHDGLLSSCIGRSTLTCKSKFLQEAGLELGTEFYPEWKSIGGAWTDSQGLPQDYVSPFETPNVPKPTSHGSDKNKAKKRKKAKAAKKVRKNNRK